MGGETEEAAEEAEEEAAEAEAAEEGERRRGGGGGGGGGDTGGPKGAHMGPLHLGWASTQQSMACVPYAVSECGLPASVPHSTSKQK